MTNPRFRDLGGADPYALLGVAPDANAEAIIRAYRRRIRQVHPDVAAGNEEQAKLLHIARDILLDPIERREYDESVRPGRPGAAADGPPTAAAWDDPPAAAEWPDPPAASAWDADDVTVGAMSSPITDPGGGYDPYGHDRLRYYQPHDQYQAYDQYQPYLDPRLAYPPRRRSYLGIWALVLSALCGPVGLVLAILALAQASPDEVANRVCAWIALVWGALSLCLCVGYLGLVWISWAVPSA